MIYRLEVENFYCFRDSQILDLTVPRTTPDDPGRFEPIFEAADIRVPKVVAVFGANGSGKSTVLKALALLRWFARDSFMNTAQVLPCERFIDEASAKRPVRLAVEFNGLMDLNFGAAARAAEGERGLKGVYRYELELATKDGLVTTVIREVLRQKPEARGRWLRVFEREEGKKLLGSNVFPLSGYAKVVDKIRDNASVISTLNLFEHEPSQVLVAATNNIFSNIFLDKTELSDIDTVRFLAENSDLVTALNKELQRIDVGVRELQIIRAESGPTPQFKHDGLHRDLPWNLESHGTRSFIRIFPWLRAALTQGGIAVIDELDLSIHPLVLPEIVRWFYDPRRNPHGAQLWMTCQSVSLMSDLVKEEIVLCEKDRQGRSKIYSLMDMKAVGRGDNLYKKYLGGVYGAVPHIG